MWRPLLVRAAAALGSWQGKIVTKQKLDHGEIPHPAAAPLSTDQEAGGNASTPGGMRIHDNGMEEHPTVRKR